jgi:hypothetical protein
MVLAISARCHKETFALLKVTGRPKMHLLLVPNGRTDAESLLVG